jgi:uncharacterized protein
MLRPLLILFISILLSSPVLGEQPDTQALMARAQKGEPEAEVALGNAAREGKKFDLARIWYLSAARHGSARAQYYLGRIYRDGEGVPIDEKQAVKWLHHAASGGYVRAQIDLGSMFVGGREVKENYAEATRWWRMAAAKGDVDTQWKLGLMYAAGDHVRQDYAEAAKWFRLAASQGDPHAQHSLGQMYLAGDGVPRVNDEALFWLTLSKQPAALKLGPRPEKIKLGHGIETLRKQMTPAQIKDAERRIAEWKPRPTPVVEE